MGDCVHVITVSSTPPLTSHHVSTSTRSSMAQVAATSDAESLEKLREAHKKLRKEVAKIIIGQESVLDQLLMAIFCRSHALLVGVPGLAKTLMVSTLSQALDLSFK